MNTKSSLPHLKYRPDIDGLRAIAVLAVIGFHYGLPFDGPDSDAFLEGGFIGVDVFFVISGYMIGSIVIQDLEAQTFSLASFYRRRVVRLFPSLILVLAASWTVGWYFLLSDEYKSLGGQIAAGAAFVANILLWNTSGYFAVVAQDLPLLHLWSLGVEEQFYLAWPLITLLLWKVRPSLVPASILVFGIASLATGFATYRDHPDAAFYLPMARFWEIMIGAALAYYDERIKVWLEDTATRPAIVSAVACCLILISILNITGGIDLIPIWRAVIATIGTTLLIAAGPMAWINRYILGNSALVYIGLISYPLYLWHWPALYFGRVGWPEGSADLIKIYALAISFAFAALSYHAVEKKIRFGAYRSAAVAPLLIGMFAVGLLGLGTWANDGFPSRFPIDKHGLLKYSYDFTTGYRVATCHLLSGQKPDEFTPDCFGTDGKPADILLWGDSLAADLYPGLKAKLPPGISLAELTSSACPPLLGDYKPHISRPYCADTNRFILNWVKENRPTTVLLSMAVQMMPAENERRLIETGTLVKSLGVKNVVIVGVAPEWPEVLPRFLYRAYQKSSTQSPPESIDLRKDWSRRLHDIDDRLERMAHNSQLKYASPLRSLCNGDRCVVMISGEPVAWDRHHLTGTGAEYVVEGLLEQAPFYSWSKK